MIISFGTIKNDIDNPSNSGERSKKSKFWGLGGDGWSGSLKGAAYWPLTKSAAWAQPLSPPRCAHQT